MDRKRGRPDGASNGNGVGSKRTRDSDSFQPGIGSKSKPCTKFFSTAGCPFGEGCHFLHYVSGGVNAVSQMSNLGSTIIPQPSRKPIVADGSTTVKTKMCNKFNTPEGCKFGDKCRFAHGERELGRAGGPPPALDRSFGAPLPGRMPGRFEPPPPALNAAAASFGQSATAKISVDASLAGAIIGKGGVNSKHICRVTGAKLSIKDHESDQNLKNIELEGTFDQIKQASAMVRELIMNVSSSAPPVARNPGVAGGGGSALGNNFKTKLCDNFTKGTCTFGDRCHFAHGPSDLRKSGTA